MARILIINFVPLNLKDLLYIALEYYPNAIFVNYSYFIVPQCFAT